MKNLIKKFIPSFLLSWYHFLLAFLGAVWYRFPSRKLKVIGITGTNGKTTTSEMVSKILEEAGYKVSLLNSIRFKVGEKEEKNLLKMTMPGRFKIQKFLREAVNSGCQYAILEVTSEGIKQHRHKFINFTAAIFTNLAPEHIEAHGGFENYKKAKGKFFQATRNIQVINIDDRNADYFLQFPSQKKFGFSREESRISVFQKREIKFLWAKGIKLGAKGVSFKIDNLDIDLKLLGGFNVSNALAAICLGISQGISLEICKRALEKIEGIPGRMEKVISQPFKVIIDYAFTPNALEKVYRTFANLPKLSTNNQNILEMSGQISEHWRLICVLGACGGGRDKWKRPVLGEIAAKYCDEIIVTNEDPYDEEPMEIINQVAKGTKGKARKILDRREAIKEALRLAKPNDLVIITGKGSEPWIYFAKGKKIPWDDRQVVKEEFAKLSLF